MQPWEIMTSRFLNQCVGSAICAFTVLCAEEQSPAAKKIQYRVPAADQPAVRINSMVRGESGSQPILSVLAPEHIGLTLKEQPSLFWFQSELADKNFELTMVERKKPKPVLEVKILDPKNSGIHRLRLTDHKIKLAFNVEYEWTVALIAGPEKRSADVISRGAIKRIIPSDGLSAKLKKADKTELPFLYAEEGIWYDSVESLSDLIDEHPNEPNLRQLRADLLSQVGLNQAADYEIKLVKGK